MARNSIEYFLVVRCARGGLLEMSINLSRTKNNSTQIVKWRVQLHIPKLLKEKIERDAADEARHYTALLSMFIERFYEKPE